MATKMPTTRHGLIGEFDNTQEDWDSYVERVSLYLVANDIEDGAKKRVTLLTVCGPKTCNSGPGSTKVAVRGGV